MEKHLLVKRSTIPRAGKGLFTKKFIEKGKIIVEYKGKVTSWMDADHDDGNNLYIYYVNRNHVIDAKDIPSALGRYANDSKGPFRIDGLKNNAQYVNVNNRVFIKSLKDIEAGSEILVGYGKGYWDVLKKNGVV